MHSGTFSFRSFKIVSVRIIGKRAMIKCGLAEVAAGLRKEGEERRATVVSLERDLARLALERDLAQDQADDDAAVQQQRADRAARRPEREQRRQRLQQLQQRRLVERQETPADRPEAAKLLLERTP